MAEVYEMHQVGAVGQTDGVVPSASVSLRSKLMQYCASLNIPYLHFPFEGKLVTGGSVNEGFVNVNLGLKGLPVASETIALLADLEMAKWLNTPVRILGISSKESVEIVRQAKANQMNVRVAVPIMNLVYTEDAVGEFDENYKVLPPLRTEGDRKALVEAVLDGTIDAIMSNHLPSDIESKNVEFDYAHFGAATLPAFFPMLLEAFGEQHLDKAIQALTVGAHNFYNLPKQSFNIGSTANLTFFNVGEKLEITNQNKGTKAFNVLGLNQSHQGKVIATFCKGKLNKN
jgi:dihydroorotase